MRTFLTTVVHRTIYVYSKKYYRTYIHPQSLLYIQKMARDCVRKKNPLYSVAFALLHTLHDRALHSLYLEVSNIRRHYLYWQHIFAIGRTCAIQYIRLRYVSLYVRVYTSALEGGNEPIKLSHLITGNFLLRKNARVPCLMIDS